jgi:hypothetical protein
MAWGRKRRWVRSTAGIAVVAILSLTCAPVCGSILDVDPVSCCQRHGCIPAGDNPTSMMGGGSHPLMVMAPAWCDTIGFDAASCCQVGDLTYPTAQVRASGVGGFALQVAVGLGVPVAQLPSQFGRETTIRPLSTSPPTPLYTLYATLRI